MKKILSILLAFIMVFSAVVPALAQETVVIKNINTVEVEKSATAAEIKTAVEQVDQITLEHPNESVSPREKTVGVEWKIEGVNPGEPGTYYLVGTYELPVGDDWKDLKKADAELSLTIKDAPAEDVVTIEPIAEVEATYAENLDKIKEKLPKTITLKYKDKTFIANVTWKTENLKPHVTGSYTLTGDYNKPEGLDVDEAKLPEAKVVVKIAKPIIKSISFADVPDSYDFENNMTAKKISDDILGIVKENKDKLYYLYDGAKEDIKVLMNPLEVKIEIKDFTVGVPGEYEATMTVVVHGVYDYAEGVSTSKKIKINILNNIVELEELGYKLDGKETKIKLTKNPTTQRQDLIYRVVLPKDTKNIPTVFYKLSERSKDAEVIEFVQPTLLPGDKGFKITNNEAKIRLKSKDGSYEALYKVIFTRETDPLKDGRVYGSDRIKTSIEMSKKFFLQADTVVIASASNTAYVDALAAAPLADLEHAPILLNGTDSLDANVKAELQRLGTKNVIIVGGENSLSANVVSGLSGYTVKRVAGGNRYLTSIEIAKAVFERSDANRKVVLVDGTNYPDALASSVVANPQGIPILLTSPKTLQEDVKKYLNDIKNEVVTIVGGPSSVSEDVKEELEKIATVDNVKRLYGADRYKTAIAVAKATYTAPQAILFADANGYADALVAGAVTNRIGAPIILTNTNTVVNDVSEYVKANKTAVQIVVGGPNSITETVLKQLLALK